MASPFSIRNFVAKQMMKTNDQGIVNMPSSMKLDFGEAVITKTLLDAGIDPSLIRNEKQLEAILDNVDKMMKKAAAPIDKGIASSESAKIFNLQGEKLDPNLPIIGGTQQGKKINREFFERDAEAKELQKRIESGVASTVEKMLRMDPMDAMKEANLVIGRKGPYKNLSQKDAKNILDSTEDHIFERNIKPKETDMDFDDNDFADGGRIGLKNGNGVADEEAENARFAKRVRELMDEGFDMGEAVREAMKEGYADGGRIGLKDGMDRRTFMKIMAGLASLPVVGKVFKGAKVASKVAPVAEKAVGASSGQPPAYFFNLVKKIKNLGDDVTKKQATKEREKVTQYKDYELTEDLDTGQIQVSKKKLGYDERFNEGIVSEEYMSFKPGQADETTRGKKVADEYEENTGYVDKDGKLKDVEEGVSEETIQEGTVFEDNITDFATKEKTTKIKKAGGGVAYMLGE